MVLFGALVHHLLSTCFPSKVAIPCPNNSSLDWLVSRASRSRRLDSVTVVLFSMAIATSYHTLCGFRNRNAFSYNFGYSGIHLITGQKLRCAQVMLWGKCVPFLFQLLIIANVPWLMVISLCFSRSVSSISCVYYKIVLCLLLRSILHLESIPLIQITLPILRFLI